MTPTEKNPQWYKDAIIYEVHVRAFHDANGDGIGDFEGLTQKLDYLQDLGVTAIWLLPFYPSPLRDDGYDIADYYGIHPDYGTLKDFKEFMREAKSRGLRVITEVVLNHTSNQHEWFQEARRAPRGSRERNFYVWNDNSEKYGDTRIIFKDFEPSNWTWDPVAKAYFWHRFYSHQPDLNFESPDVRKAVLKVIDFWLEMGVDGLRLDAVPYLYEREGTSCENLDETHAFLKELRRHVDLKFKDRMLLAEANQWPEEAAAYFGAGAGDECHMAFHFPIMPRLFMGLHMEDRFPVIDILQQTPQIPDNGQWALFLRNHDELTLEMVTDEERDYMYRVYAVEAKARINLGIRRRLAPLLGNHRRKIELMNGLLFSLPGTPILYYGDEIGMGDNIYLRDRDGVRTPMQWSADRNAGFSRANAQQLYLPVGIDPEFHYEAVNVDAQQKNSHSLLWWMKRLITFRKRYRALNRGSIEFLQLENRKVLAFVRSLGEERILVVANLSRFVQYAEIDLSAFKGMTPVEIFGRIAFPPVGDKPYFLTLGPHSFYWFTLKDVPAAVAAPVAAVEPELELDGDLEQVFSGRAKTALEELLPPYMKDRRWFGGKARTIKAAQIQEVIQVSTGAQEKAYVTLVQVQYYEGVSETYVLPLTFVSGDKEKRLRDAAPGAVIAVVKDRRSDPPAQAVLCEAVFEQEFCTALLDSMERRRSFKGKSGRLAFSPSRAFRALRGENPAPLTPAVLKGEQSNSSVAYGNKFVLKLFRRFQEGLNPDLEIGRFLTEKGFAHIPPVAGAVEYERPGKKPATLGVLQGFVPNEGDAWQYTIDALGTYFERVLAQHAGAEGAPKLDKSFFALIDEPIDPKALEWIGSYLETARSLGRRTAELHLTLSKSEDDPAFAPEPFTAFYQRSVYQSMRNLTREALYALRKKVKGLPEPLAAEAKLILGREADIYKRFQAIVGKKLTGLRIRCHGDFHLGQVLYTGKDFVFIDFEGEPARTLEERRIKRSPLRDVAGMIRSFYYAPYTILFGRTAPGITRAEDAAGLEAWARFWYTWVSSSFLRSYLDAAREGSFLPKERKETDMLLQTYLLEKAVYEMMYELNNRPDWLKVPLSGIMSALETKV